MIAGKHVEVEYHAFPLYTNLYIMHFLCLVVDLSFFVSRGASACHATIFERVGGATCLHCSSATLTGARALGLRSGALLTRRGHLDASFAGGEGGTTFGVQRLPEG